MQNLKMTFRAIGYFALYFIITSFLWTLVNEHIIALFPTLYIPSWPVKMPIVPSSIYIYATYYFLVPTFILFYNQDIYFKKIFYIVLFWVCLNLTLNILFPSQLSDYHLGQQINPPDLYNFIKSQDNGWGVIPCGHVSLPICIAVGLFHIKRYIGSIIFMIWAVFLGISTLLCHQHYVIDLVAGYAYGLLSILLYRKYIKSR